MSGKGATPLIENSETELPPRVDIVEKSENEREIAVSRADSRASKACADQPHGAQPVQCNRV